MASVCTSIQNNSTSCLSQPSSEQNDKCSIKSNSSSSTLIVEEDSSPSKNVSQNYSRTNRGATASRSSNKCYISPSILMPPPGTYPRIPPFPGVPPPTPASNIYFSVMPPPQPSPTQSTYPQDLMFTIPPPVFLPQPCLIYQPISESSGYRLMMFVAVGHREDGTYGILTYVRPDQEYRVSCIYANNVTYYNLPTNIPTVNGPSLNMM